MIGNEVVIKCSKHHVLQPLEIRCSVSLLFKDRYRLYYMEPLLKLLRTKVSKVKLRQFSIIALGKVKLCAIAGK